MRQADEFVLSLTELCIVVVGPADNSGKALKLEGIRLKYLTSFLSLD
jgi:hypothetical protein